MELKRTDIILKPNNARVLFRPFEPADRSRAMRIVARVMELSDAEVERVLEVVLSEFHGRHQRASRSSSSRASSTCASTAHRRAGERNAAAADRRVLHAGVRARIGGAVQPVDGLAPRPIRACRTGRSGSSSACGPPAKGTSRRSRSAAA